MTNALIANLINGSQKIILKIEKCKCKGRWKIIAFHTVGHFSTPTAFSPSNITEESAFQKRITQTK